MRICSGAGCLRAVEDDVRFCEECAPLPPVVDGVRDHTTGYDAELDRLRKGTRWQRLRAFVVRKQPVCARCDSLTEIVDHIVPAREAVVQAQLSGEFVGDKYAGYYLVSNLQGLCRRCHFQKTIYDKTHAGRWPSVVDAERRAPRKRYSF